MPTRRSAADDFNAQEEAWFRLEFENDPKGALALALKNWAIQKEPRDAEIVLEAALAARDPASAKSVLDWMARTGIEDPRLSRACGGAEKDFAVIRASRAARLLLALAQPALAHKPSDSYLAFQVEGPNIAGQWDIALRDLEYAIGLDANGDGEITWGELKAKHDAIAAYALGRLKLRADGRDCDLKATRSPRRRAFRRRVRGAAFRRRLRRRAEPARSRSTTASFSTSIRRIGGCCDGSRARSRKPAFSSPDRPTMRMQGEETTRLAQFFDYGREGVWHIWIGIDHILFLLSLLLPAVLVASGARLGRRPTFRPRVLGCLQDRHLVHRGALDHALARGAVGHQPAIASWSRPPSPSPFFSPRSTISGPWFTAGAGWSLSDSA